jgi:hypothetical protein
LPKYLDSEAFVVINGAVEHTTKLMEKQWGHGQWTDIELARHAN